MRSSSAAAPVVALTDETRFDLEADVVVVGSGAAAISAALNALGAGVEVVMLEKSATLGGTTGKSSAFAWYPNHYGQQADGIVDDKADALKYMARLTHPDRYDPASPTLGMAEWEHALMATFFDHAADAAESLHAHGMRTIHLRQMADYFADLPENKAPFGRTLRPAKEDGSDGNGLDFVAQGTGAVAREGGRILTEHGVTGVIAGDADVVVGVTVDHAGTPLNVRARRGVVFGSGGFSQNEERLHAHTAAPILGSCAAPGCTGDLLDIAEALGAPLRTMTYPWMTLMPLEWALKKDPEVKSLFHPPGDSMLFVNGTGRRTLNEKGPYNETAQMLQRWDVRNARYTDLFQFMVWDQACQDLHAHERPANPIRPTGEPAPHVVKGATLEELAANLTARVRELQPRVPSLFVDDAFGERLRASVERFNASARAAKDEDFFRGDMPIERFFNEMFTGGIRDERNPLMFPLEDRGPYYATIIVPAALDTKGGPPINSRAEIVRADGSAIEGLYGAGNCVASPSGKAYWAGGGTIGPAVTFGYLAGRNAARTPVRELASTVAA